MVGSRSPPGLQIEQQDISRWHQAVSEGFAQVVELQLEIFLTNEVVEAGYIISLGGAACIVLSRNIRIPPPSSRRRTNLVSRRIQKEGDCGITMEGVSSRELLSSAILIRLRSGLRVSSFNNKKPPLSPSSGPFVEWYFWGGRLLREKPLEVCFAGSVPWKHCLQIRGSQMLCGDLTKDVAEIRG